MGLYIDPNGMSKEQWLEENGTVVRANFIDPSTGDVAVCLVDNGFFTAAAVAYKDSEFVAFNQSTDYRPKKWFKVSAKHINEVTNGNAAGFFKIED